MRSDRRLTVRAGRQSGAAQVEIGATAIAARLADSSFWYWHGFFPFLCINESTLSTYARTRVQVRAAIHAQPLTLFTAKVTSGIGKNQKVP